MARDISNLEPADRDPAQLRRTAFAMVFVIVVGGILVALAYLKTLERQSLDPRPGVITRLEKRFGAVNQDRKAFETLQLEGKVTLLTPVCLSEPEHMRESLRVMKLVAEHFKDEERMRFIGITVDPERDELAALKQFAADLGVADDPRWQFIATDEGSTRSYLQEELRFGVVKEKVEEGRKGIDFQSMIAVIDQYLHLRGQYEPNDAVRVQTYARKVLAEEPDSEERETAAEHTDDLEVLEKRLLEVVGILLNEELEGKGPKS